MKEPIIHVIFRACDVVNAVNANPRPFNLDKTTLVKLSFQSLYDSLQGIPHTIHVIGDKLSTDLQGFFASRNCVLIQGEYGNDESIRQTFNLAAQFSDDDWIYFCEDDYVHVQHAMRYIHNFLKNPHQTMDFAKRLYTWSSFINLKMKDIVIHPTDYPDRYSGKYRRFSLVFHSDDCHWRQITDTTFTFLMKGSTFKKHKNLLLRCAKGANDRMLSKKLYGRFTFFNKVLALSPMPSLATHMHRDTMSPLVDWEAVVTSMKDKITTISG
ncbi:MAG: hypothetical protein ACO3EO_03300 [Candidatus Kapaibacteriota bacterium]